MDIMGRSYLLIALGVKWLKYKLFVTWGLFSFSNSIKMEVGIEDCLHIEFEYNKSKYVHAAFSYNVCI